MEIRFSVLVAVLALYFSGAKCDDDEFAKEGNVYVLYDDNFDKFIEKNPNALVEFYAPWCGHCKSLAPEYDKAALTLKDFGVPLAKVDATQEKALQTRFDINGFPILKFWREGEMEDYEGPRDAEGIVTWVAEKTDPNYQPPPSAVLTLTEANFTQHAEAADIILVEFYAPWCGHCKKLAPEFENAAKRLKEADPSIPLAKVDATAEPNLAKEFGVSGYPTIKILRKGKRFEYKGPREAQGIVSYMKEQAKAAARHLKSIGEVKRFMLQDDVTIVGYFDEDGEKLFGNFKDAADEMREDFKAVGFVDDAEVAKAFNVPVNDVAVLLPERYYSKYEPKLHLLAKPDASREDIVAFWNSKCVPLVGQRTQENLGRRYVDRPLVVVYYTVDFSHAHRDGTQYWRQKILNVANQNKGTYFFAISDEQEFSKELDEMGLGDSGQEINVAVFGKDGKKYPWDPEEDDFSEEALRDFLKKMDKGQIKPHIKSQPLPKDDKGPVKTVVASNFDNVVTNSKDKDVLIEFYAPWCGHCKALEPIYKKLAQKYKDEKQLIIAKFDATANDVPSDKYKVEGFPTIYFKPAGSDEPLKFDGGRTLEDFETYLKDKCMAAFKTTKKEDQKEEL